MSIRFTAPLISIHTIQIIRLPSDASAALPSRGLVMVQGSINNIAFTTPLEPDGKGSHWFEVSHSLLTQANLVVGETVSILLEPCSEWTEPEVPVDIQYAIEQASLSSLWESLTTSARWDWIRWIRSTNNPQTRQKRIEVACSKLQKGERRPCCFDRTRCTVPSLSKSGVLSD